MKLKNLFCGLLLLLILAFSATGLNISGANCRDGDHFCITNGTSNVSNVALSIERNTGDTIISGDLNVTENARFAKNVSVGSVNSFVEPGINDTYDLGALGNIWRNIYVGIINLITQLTDDQISDDITANATKLIEKQSLNDTHFHAAENITSGTFGSGDYNFPGNVEITENLQVTGSYVNLTGGNITRVNTIRGNGTYVRIGDAKHSNEGLTSDDDLFISGKLEVDEIIYADGGLRLINDKEIELGSSADALFGYQGSQTPDALVLGLNELDSNNFIIVQNEQINTDFAHPKQPDPTIFLHGNDSSDTSEWLSLSYRNNSNDGYIATGKGNLTLNSYSGDVDLVNGNLTRVNTIMGNGTNVRIGNVGIPNHVDADDDLFISGRLEVDGTTYFDGTVLLAQDREIKIASTNVGGSIIGSSSQTPATAVWGLGDRTYTLLFVPYANRAVDMAHPKQPDPTIFLHGNDSSDTSEWLSFSYLNATDEGYIATGKGDLTLSPAGGNVSIENNLLLGTGTEWLSMYLIGSKGYLDSTVPLSFTKNIDMEGQNITNINTLRGNGSQINIGNRTSCNGPDAGVVNGESDLYVCGNMEVDGVIYADKGVTIPDQWQASWGSSLDAGISYRSDHSPNTWIFSVGGESNAMLIMERDDRNVDMAHPLQEQPTIFIHGNDSVDQNDYLSLAYNNDTQEGLISVGHGLLKIGNSTATSSSAGLGNSGDLLVTEKFEVDGNSYFDGSTAFAGINSFSGGRLTISADVRLNFVTTTTTHPRLAFLTSQNPNTLVLGLGTDSRSLIVTDASRSGTDYAHPKQTDPTIFIHSNTSATQDATKWLSLTYKNATNEGLIATGKGNLTLNSYSGDIDLVNGNLTRVNTIRGNGTYVRIGDAGHSSSILLNDDDLFVSGRLEVDGTVAFDNEIFLLDGFRLRFGTGNVGHIAYNNVQTVKSFFWGTGADSNSIILAENADRNINFAHVKQPDPTLFIQSSNQSFPNQYLSLTHNESMAQIQSGNGSIMLNATNAPVVIGDAGATSRGLVDGDDLFVSGKLEVDGPVNFDSTSTFASTMWIGTNVDIKADSSYGVIRMGTNIQTPITMQIMTGSLANNILITEFNDASVDMAHPKQPDPTIFMHGNDSSDTSEWLSFSYRNFTNDGYLATGKGNLTLNPASIVSIDSDLNVINNITGNFIYGELWNYTANESAWTFPIATSGIYYNFTGLICGSLNGFNCTLELQANGGSYLTADVDGKYKVDLSLSFFTLTPGGTYGVGIGKNFDIGSSRNCYSRRVGTGSVGNIGISCFLDLIKGDNVNILVEDEGIPPKDMMIHTVNVNLMRVGT